MSSRFSFSGFANRDIARGHSSSVSGNEPSHFTRSIAAEAVYKTACAHVMDVSPVLALNRCAAGLNLEVTLLLAAQWSVNGWEVHPAFHKLGQQYGFETAVQDAFLAYGLPLELTVGDCSFQKRPALKARYDIPGLLGKSGRYVETTVLPFNNDYLPLLFRLALFKTLAGDRHTAQPVNFDRFTIKAGKAEIEGLVNDVHLLVQHLAEVWHVTPADILKPVTIHSY